ncbi:MAG: phosphodiester glycosidase family protein [Cyanothece sp. SIO1E1]|nr:phosphodiester glycosidase family protein [Cyanothece sp. SIO1E1]
MHSNSSRFTKRFLPAIGSGLLLLPFLIYGSLQSQRPPRTDATQALFQGITYQRQVRSTPRPQVIHIIAIDLNTPGIRAFVTPAKSTAREAKTEARTTSEFVKEFELQLAVNASYFSPFYEKTPWDYYPRRGQRVNPIGQVISNGHEYSMSQANWPVLCFLASRRIQILKSGICPEGTNQAIAGNEILVAEGASVVKPSVEDSRQPYARVAAGIDESGQKLWLVVIDGKQLHYSEGATRAELANIIQALGAETGLNLDGGGSTTLAIATPSGSAVLNAPIHTKLPMRERPVANHLGFYASPASEVSGLD